jgi:hypothetical protein
MIMIVWHSYSDTYNSKAKQNWYTKNLNSPPPSQIRFTGAERGIWAHNYPSAILSPSSFSGVVEFNVPVGPARTWECEKKLNKTM